MFFMTVLKIVLIYVGIVFMAIPYMSAMFSLNHTKQEAETRDGYSKKLLRFLFVLGIILLVLGVILCFVA